MLLESPNGEIVQNKKRKRVDKKGNHDHQDVVKEKKKKKHRLPSSSSSLKSISIAFPESWSPPTAATPDHDPAPRTTPSIESSSSTTMASSPKILALNDVSKKARRTHQDIQPVLGGTKKKRKRNRPEEPKATTKSQEKLLEITQSSPSSASLSQMRPKLEEKKIKVKTEMRVPDSTSSTPSTQSIKNKKALSSASSTTTTTNSSLSRPSIHSLSTNSPVSAFQCPKGTDSTGIKTKMAPPSSAFPNGRGPTDQPQITVATSTAEEKKKKKKNGKSRQLPFDHCYILAPMVGASELPFRLLCRKYGTQLAYTPMLSAHQLAHDELYRHQELAHHHVVLDRPLVYHLAANQPADFAAAARIVAPFCDAIDLNLGCPQRTAYVGHFGSYLLDPPDRTLICDMVRAGVQAVQIPIFCKIRLLNTLEETIQLCQQLRNAGASLIAIHARYRASWERQGPGARDGPAHLDQVAKIKAAVPNVLIVTNGNTITYQNVEENLALTQADGLMSAEGLLDNPALFLPRYGPSTNRERRVEVPIVTSGPIEGDDSHRPVDPQIKKRKRELKQRLQRIKDIESKVASKTSDLQDLLDESEIQQLASKPSLLKELDQIKKSILRAPDSSASSPARIIRSEIVTLGSLYDAAHDKMTLAREYLSLVGIYPTKMRTVVFHIRRMLKDVLVKYQLLEECINAESTDQLNQLLDKMDGYQKNPNTFVFDQQKAKEEREALERRRREESKRKEYEARMIRKAKREGKTDLMHYLKIGSAVPTIELVKLFKSLPREEAMIRWKQDHAQHCLAHHLEPGGCPRGRGCAFLHMDCQGANSFVEKDEVAG